MKMKIFILLIVIFIIGCNTQITESESVVPTTLKAESDITEEKAMGEMMKIESDAFKDGNPIPQKYSCQGS